MSLASSPDQLFRAEDQAAQFFFPTIEEPATDFDALFNSELYAQGEITTNKTTEDSDTFLLNEFNHSDNTFQNDPFSPEPTQPWRKGLWCLGQNDSTKPLVVEKTRSHSRFNQAFVSPTHLVSKTNRPNKPLTTKAQSPETKSTLPKAAVPASIHGSYPVTREQTLSPSPLYARTANSKVDHEMWQQDFQNFHLRSGGTVSPPSFNPYLPSRPQTQHHHTCRTQRDTILNTPSSPTKYHYPLQNGSHVLAASCDCSNVPHTNVAAEMAPVQYAMPDQHTAPIWTTESLHSSDGSHYSHATNNSHNSQCSHESHTNPYHICSSRTWASPPPNYVSRIPPPPQEYCPNIAAPRPQRIPHHVLQHQDQELLRTGLAIHYPPAEEVGVALPYDMYQPTQLSTPHRSTALTSHPVSYPPLPPPPEDFPIEDPFTTPHRSKSYSHSPSPPLSPTRRPGRISAQRSSSRPDESRHRRKSIHKAGPIRDTAISNANNSAFETTNANHRRARSSSRPPRTPKTPKTPRTPTTTSAIDTFGQMSFVNFTPHDSQKLMNDVAPSGSSKTRARREQEARDKRKKLSEAALQAVRRAGGDVRVLEKLVMA